MFMFFFLVVALAVVVAAVTLAVLGGGGRGPLPYVAPDLSGDHSLAPDRPVGREDVDALRFPLVLRGYRMADVDDALGRLGAELDERDSRIADLEAALAGARAGRGAGPDRGTEEEQQ
ncbi:DivIVA domain-containing protein [Streptomyces nodosus]